MSKKFHELTVSKVRQETSDCVSVSFSVPDQLKDEFDYQHGQYLTLRFNINGQDVRRSYSMSSSPHQQDLTVTVKRVDRGLVSNYINDQLKEGSKVSVMPPDGRFTIRLDPGHQKDYYLFGAGSGITPLMSIIGSILEVEPKSKVNLLYGNRNESGIIFREPLKQMEQRYEGQLNVTHILSRPKQEKQGGLFGAFKKSVSTWDGWTGRINAASVRKFKEAFPPVNQSAEYFICGPHGMIEVTEQTLQKMGIDDKQIHTEHFTAADVPQAAAGTAAAVGASDAQQKLLIATMDGKRIETPVPDGKTVLDTLLDLKYEPPYSCTSGSCSTCMAKVTKGSVRMDVCYALDDDEIEEGFILTCQAHPTSEVVELTFDI